MTVSSSSSTGPRPWGWQQCVLSLWPLLLKTIDWSRYKFLTLSLVKCWTSFPGCFHVLETQRIKLFWLLAIGSVSMYCAVDKLQKITQNHLSHCDIRWRTIVVISSGLLCVVLEWQLVRNINRSSRRPSVHAVAKKTGHHEVTLACTFTVHDNYIRCNLQGRALNKLGSDCMNVKLRWRWMSRWSKPEYSSPPPPHPTLLVSISSRVSRKHLGKHPLVVCEVSCQGKAQPLLSQSLDPGIVQSRNIMPCQATEAFLFWTQFNGSKVSLSTVQFSICCLLLKPCNYVDSTDSNITHTLSPTTLNK